MKTETIYIVSKQIWTGQEPCGRSEYNYKSWSFHKRSEAIKCFNETKARMGCFDELTLIRRSSKVIMEAGRG